MSSRRQIIAQGLSIAASVVAPAYAVPRTGGRLVIGITSEPSVLTTAGPTQYVSSKIFDGLVTYDNDFRPQPQLASSWQLRADGKTIVFKLRPGVRWHDGKAFTSSDVAFSVLNVCKQYHARGRSTFADVVRVDTPDPLTAVWHLAKPAPAILSPLNSAESQIVPRHLYEGQDVLSNPRNIAPIGTGPFRFAEWRRGNYIALERNHDYWQKGKPYLDNIIFRVLPDPASMVSALETRDVQLIFPAPPSDAQRLSRVPGLTLRSGSSITSALTAFEFNLERPFFRDIRVRQAFAHAIDKEFLLQNVFFGQGSVANSTLPQDVANFQALGLAKYPFDLDKAGWLLDQAGLKRSSDGTRLAITHNPSPTGSLVQAALFLRSTFAKIGVRMDIRTNDFATFVRRVYAQRDFDTSIYSATSGPDAAIGTQRFYWSKDFLPGVAFSNGAHYANPRVDQLLEQGQSENDPAKRKTIYGEFQRVVQVELPRIPLVFNKNLVVGRVELHDYWSGAYGILENFAVAYLAK